MEDYTNQYKDSSDNYMQGETPPLPPEFDNIVKLLDKERERVYKKNKGLFKKSFFVIWSSIIAITAILVFIFSGDKFIILGVGGFLGSFISAIAAFIYITIVKANAYGGFIPKMKKELVGKILKEVNSDLTFFEEGISKEHFKKAELFNAYNFISEDSIKGLINGQEVIITECRDSNSIENSNSHPTYTSELAGSSFNGIFIQLKLTSVNTKCPIKIIPSFLIENNFKITPTLLTPVAEDKITYRRIKIKIEDNVPLAPSFEKSNYEFFSKDKQEVELFVNKSRLKVLDYIFNKYGSIKPALFSNSTSLKRFNMSSALYLSIIGNNLYIAIDWHEDLFETDVFLKEGIEETNLAQKIHRDLLFINQLINELSLIDKTNE